MFLIRLSAGGAAVTMTGWRSWSWLITRHAEDTAGTSPRRPPCPPGAGWWSGEQVMTYHEHCVQYLTRLVTDATVTRPGFKLSWVRHECGGRVTAPGEIR